MQGQIIRPIILIAALALAAGCASEQPKWDPSDSADHDYEATENTLSVSEIAAGTREGDWLILDPIAAPAGVWRVGVLVGQGVEGPVPPLEGRLLVDGYPISDWTPLAATWSEVDRHVAVANFSAVGTAAQIRVHVDALDTLSFLRWSAVRPADPSDGKADDGSDYGTMIAPLRSELAGLGIVTREAWGARSSSCSSNTSKNKMTIHHTETPSDNPERQVRAIQNYHKDTRGWCDIGYHFLVGVDGSIYEGRPLEKLGAHVGGQNTGNIGISFIGCFHPGCSWGPTTPPDAALDAAARLIAALSDLYGIDLSSSVIKGHGDWPGTSTDCPGDNLDARIDDIIDAARSGSLPYETPDLPDPPSVDPSECGSLDCGACAASSGCGWCAARGSCGSSTDACTWTGSVGGETCWSELWPCAVARCWNPNKTLTPCGSTEWNEDFSSGSYSVHRYWTSLPEGGPITIRLERTGGTFGPALLVADRGGRLAYGGEIAALHPDITVLSAVSGRSGSAAEVTLLASRNIDVYLFVTGWAVLDDAFGGSLPTSSRYHVSIVQSCEDITTPIPAGDIWTPGPGITWQWQLEGSLDTSFDVQMYDIDLFDAPASTIASLRAAGRKVICYFSAGTYESGRPDSGAFPSSVLGSTLPDWPGERWLDIRDTRVADIMRARMDLAVSKGCDGVEPDNVDGYQNASGFSLTAADQIAYNRMLASEAHARGLSVGLKNDVEQVWDLVADFDWTLNEQCMEYGECGMLQPFLDAGKAVFHVEYGDASTAADVCPDANARGFSTLIKHEAGVDAWRIACTDYDDGGSDGVYGGLTQDGSEVPRAGLYNPTMAFLGTTTEPYGTVITDSDGLAWVRGKVSWFGGPSDTGVTATETGAITGEILRDLNDPLSPSAATLASRPEDYYYVAMRWCYTPNGRSWWANARLVVKNPTTGAAVVVRPVDWGPNTSTGRILDLSPQSLSDLGLSTDQNALVAFAPPGTPLGPVH